MEAVLHKKGYLCPVVCRYTLPTLIRSRRSIKKQSFRGHRLRWVKGSTPWPFFICAGSIVTLRQRDSYSKSGRENNRHIPPCVSYSHSVGSFARRIKSERLLLAIKTSLPKAIPKRQKVCECGRRLLLASGGQGISIIYK